MISQKKMQDLIGKTLLLGVLISSCLVLFGGILYLIDYGHSPLPSELLQNNLSSKSIHQIFAFAFSFTPLGIIELGLLILVATQSIRVALLVWFYAVLHDYKFAGICGFILIVLVYSAFWRN